MLALCLALVFGNAEPLLPPAETKKKPPLEQEELVFLDQEELLFDEDFEDDFEDELVLEDSFLLDTGIEADSEFIQEGNLR